MEFSLNRLTIVTPVKVMGGSMQIEDQLIVCVTKDLKLPAPLEINLPGRLAFPALINAHDHLLGSWFPRSRGRPYRSVYDWLRDIEGAGPTYFPEIRERRQLIGMDRVYALGCYKNLLSGVTTVIDHEAENDAPFYANQPAPIRIPRDFEREGQVYYPWNLGVREEYAKTKGKKLFVIHAAEGVDEKAAAELQELERMGVLAPNTLLVHGVGFSHRDIDKIKASGASLCVCPFSNYFLFEKTADFEYLQKAGVNVALGTDSWMTGSAHILEELKFLWKLNRQTLHSLLTPAEVVAMVTINAARAILMQDDLGSLEGGKIADILIIERLQSDPYLSLINAQPSDIVLLFHQGKPLFGDPEFAYLFQEAQVPFTTIKVQGKSKLVTGNPLQALEDCFRSIGYRKKGAYLPLDY